jgi:hypothetical protein
MTPEDIATSLEDWPELAKRVDEAIREAYEDAAKIAEEYASGLEDDATDESDPKRERCLVYAKHVRRVAREIRARMEDAK